MQQVEQTLTQLQSMFRVFDFFLFYVLSLSLPPQQVTDMVATQGEYVERFVPISFGASR
jgi:hypothetical protein